MSFDGSATITVNGTAATPSVAAATLQAALQAMPSIGTGNVLVTAVEFLAATQITEYTVTFVGALAGRMWGR